MVTCPKLVFLAVVCGRLLGACRSEELQLYAAYSRGELQSVKLRTDGFYFRSTPPCGLSDSTLEVLYFFNEGSCYHGNWRFVKDLDHFVQKLRSSQRFDSGERSGMGWGLYKWSDDTLYIEQFSHATRGRWRVASWKAVLKGDVLRKVFHEDSPYLVSGLEECVKPYDFHPSDWKPDPSRFFEQNKAFLRSQAYHMKRARKREARRSRR